MNQLFTLAHLNLIDELEQQHAWEVKHLNDQLDRLNNSVSLIIKDNQRLKRLLDER